MARKASTNSDSAHPLNDVIGLALMGLAVLLLAALLSYDRHDLADNVLPTNPSVQNWVGPFGAKLAYYWLRTVGATAYEAPALLLLVGLGCFFTPFSYLRRRWLWTLVLFVCCMCLLDLYKPYLRRFELNLNCPAGGVVGQTLNYRLFGYFGTVGGTIIFFMLSFISVLYLTNFRLGDWLNRIWAARHAVPKTEKEEALEKRAKDLENRKKLLEEEVARSGLGPDLKPVPEPTVRDLSVPQLKAGKAKKTSTAEPVKEPEPPDEGEVISAREIAAATTADVLGKKNPARESKNEPKTAAESNEPGGTEPATKPAEPVVVDASGAAPVAPSKPKLAPRKPKPITVASTPLIGNYQLPSIDFLQHPDQTLKPTESKEELMANARLMQQTLAQFDIEVSLGDITKGPTITRYELHPAPGVKLEKITALNNNIAAALKAERIHILAPVPGKSSVGVEVPNAIKTKVIMRDLLESEEWRSTKARIPLALGKDVYGNPIVADLSEMPHLLIAGSTGSGKSVCINAIISSLLYRFSPDQLRFVMIDPKVVELQQYNMLPHLVVPVVTDPKKVILALRWVVNEMEKRYQIFARVGVRNIASFNSRPKNKPLPQREPELPLMAKKEKVEPGADGFAVEVDEEIVVPREEDIVIPEKLSYIVVIIDELADLMLVAPADVEMAIARITQMARAAGIHCIVATQRPSVDVITGVIKANIPARIAFQVAAKVDSRTILDAMGADKLLGKGDMLYLPPGSAKLIRAQGALITDQEIQSIVDFIARQGKPSYEMEIHQQLSKPASSFEEESGIDEDEEIIQQCIEVIRSEQKASVSLLQRRLRLGYGRAARIMDELENRGIVGPSKGAEPRDILIDLDGTGADGAPAQNP
ncbi:MAG TPA: DNA translocase FtsK [Patescibacteria group bacterium]|nr:DNA translocase FtsK [Patescibacteria group bacterium]